MVVVSAFLECRARMVSASVFTIIVEIAENVIILSS